MMEAQQLWVDRAREHVLAKELVPIPWKERLNVVPRAPYLRKTSYYGNFSRARGPNADGVLVAEWQINPFEDQWDEKTRQEYLVEHDWGVIIVTAPHETYAGHHVQGLYQMHNPRKLRETQGISIFSEGWGLYNEELMRETGFFPNSPAAAPAPSLAQRPGRLGRGDSCRQDVLPGGDWPSLRSRRIPALGGPAGGGRLDRCARLSHRVLHGHVGDPQDARGVPAAGRRRFRVAGFSRNFLRAGNMPPALMRQILLGSLAASN
jgi:hypothetical protein